MRKLFLFIAAALFSSSMWAADVVQSFTGDDTGDYAWATTKTITKSTISIEFNNIGGGLNSRQHCKTSGTATKLNGVQVSSSAQASVNEKYIGISSETTISAVSLDISQNGTNADRTAIAIYFDNATNKKPLLHEAVSLPSYDISCDSKAEINLSIPSNCKYIRIYKQVKYDATNKVLDGSSGSNIPSSNATNFNVFGITVTAASATPTLTGAWKIDEDTVTNTNIMQEAAAPTAPTFSVGATSGTPTSDNYTVTYGLKEGSTEGIFTYSESGISAISTATAGSATFVATLTTKDDTKYLTPKTNTFEYTVTVSPAAAPTFTSVTPSATSVVRGTASTIVAVVTGTPTPTLQWYSNTTESNEGGEEIDGATDLTLNLANAAVGTYYYYAVATNTTSQVNTVASTVQTITVAPKAPVLPASSSFVDSKSVTITKADGEAEEAVIKYSTDGENWETYSAAIVIDATTTIQAKVEQSGITSAVASATYTKYDKSELVSISNSKTWTIPTSITLELKTDGTTTPAKYDEYYTYSDIATINGQDLGTFDGTTLAFSGQYPYRGSNGAQNGNFKFITTVPGKVTVEFSNTGGSNKGRFVKVNDEIGKIEADGTTKRTEEFTVADGTVIITHVDDKGALSAGLRVYSITFTKSEATSVDNTDATVKAVKRIENGQLIIEKNGVRYNAMGQAIR